MHVNEICTENDCEVKSCLKRHPRLCRYYEKFHSCKFEDRCSFSHKILDHRSELLDLKAKVINLETMKAAQDEVIVNIQVKMALLEKENQDLKRKVMDIVDKMKGLTEKVISDTSKVFLQTMTEQQDSFEKKNDLLLQSVENQLSTLTAALHLKIAADK